MVVIPNSSSIVPHLGIQHATSNPNARPGNRLRDSLGKLEFLAVISIALSNSHDQDYLQNFYLPQKTMCWAGSTKKSRGGPLDAK